jgi:hypothetical protein
MRLRVKDFPMRLETPRRSGTGRGNDCPRIGKIDRLLEALRREHGDARPDIEPATIPRPWRKFQDAEGGRQ